MKHDTGVKKQKETLGINNGLKNLIFRHEGLRDCYVKLIQDYLEAENKRVFSKSTISKVVTDQYRLTPRNISIKEAAKHIEASWNELVSA